MRESDKLTDKAIRALKPQAKDYKVSDGKGLFALVRTDGAIWWRFRYRVGGREKLISLGTYPDTSLKLARQKRQTAREQLANGIDPSEARKAERASQSNTFETIAREWLRLEKRMKATTVAQLRRRLETYAFRQLGKKPIQAIKAPDVLAVLRTIENRGTIETAHRVKSVIGRIFRYAVATGRAERDPTADLKGALASVETRHFAGLTDKYRVGDLLRAIDGYSGQLVTAAALRLQPHVFLRPSELRNGAWDEVDLGAAQWLIPGDRMKMRRDHVVPLSEQSLAILEDLRQVTGAGRLIFPSLRSSSRPLSENTVNAALRTLGFGKNEQTGHGFRTTASTLLHDLGWDSALIELQLAHADRNKVRASYNRAERLPERAKMMQAWSDYLDSLKADSSDKVRAIRA